MRALVVTAVLIAGCTVPESANPTPRCEVQSDCAENEHCYRGLCVPDAIASDAGPTCDDGKAWCDGRCVKTNDDDDHCGSCNNRCDDGHACRDGRCEEND